MLTARALRCVQSPLVASTFKSPSPLANAVTMQTTSSKRRTVVTLENMNPCIKRMEYAVRGPIVARAGEIARELEKGVKKPFRDVIHCNIGDCHAMGQKPMTFLRQVVALCTYPQLLDSPDFPVDTKEKAKRILADCKGHSLGAYTDSMGLEVVRRDTAAYIENRDGHPSDWQNCFVSTGASQAIKSVLQLLMTGDHGDNRAGIMIPIPQYPLYTASIDEFNAFPINYYLDEENGWGLDMSDLQRSLDNARYKCRPRAIVVINPGNPTGQVLSRENIENVIKFAHQEELFIMADEVYQHNIYADGAAFHSFKKVMMEMGDPYDKLELASFMTTSKGYMGECGYRGGYCEVINLDPSVKGMLQKYLSAQLCSSTSGQAAMDCVVNHPVKGDASYELWLKEKDTVLAELKTKARMATQLFNKIEGVTCNEVMGAMYAFPRLHLPDKAIQAAKAKGMAPDAFYCFDLLENTGICVVPGSGFGQKEGTHHFRMTILPPVEKIKSVLERFEKFHLQFVAKYK